MVSDLQTSCDNFKYFACNCLYSDKTHTLSFLRELCRTMQKLNTVYNINLQNAQGAFEK